MTPIGRAGEDVRQFVLDAWDDFLCVVDSCEPSRPSRLKGLSNHDLLVHLGTWDDHEVLPGLVEAARSGADLSPVDPADVTARHRDASWDEVRAALNRSRADIASWLASPEAASLGHVPVTSAVGRLPLTSVLHAGCYELAVHALDLRADEPSDRLLCAGLAALVDVTGALASQHAIAMALTAVSPEGGWAFTSTSDGWSTAPAAEPFAGPGVRGDAAVLLDASAGRAQLPGLVLRRKVKVQDMRGFLRLAPMIESVPGLPGGAVLRTGVKALAKLVG